MQDLTRRTMLKMAGGTALGLGFPGKILAVLADGTLVVQDHRVPAEKGLTAEWKATLVTRGEKEIWTGEALESIGMPIGGIATGQLYLCGDGSLGCWEIFNHHEFQDYGDTSYAKRVIPHRVEFGFAVTIDGVERKLNKSGFSNISFNGQYPIATITYRDANCPLDVQMTAYTPYVPLNAKDSALPTTVFEITIHNPGSTDKSVDLAGFLENACARSGEAAPKGRQRHTEVTSSPELVLLQHSSDPAPDEFAIQRPNPRADILIADFEGDTYGDWKVTGEAFGPGPAKGTLPDQNPVTGYQGKSLVNSFYKGDASKGRLTSPVFKLERDFINFLIGGGNHPGQTCINLLVGGKVVRTASGLNSEELLWECWSVREYSGSSAQIEIVDDSTAGWGHICIDQIGQSDKVKLAKDRGARHSDPNLDNGTLALGVLAGNDVAAQGSYGLDTKYVGRVHPPKFQLASGASKTVVFVLAWNFPHHPRGRNYENYFADSGEVVRYVAKNYRRLSRDTKLWRDTYYDSTLPIWLLDRLHSTIGNLATGTTEWWKTGRFWSWEGVVCCSGTCTHVWNYEHSMSRLFPEIERNIRERQDFGAGFDEATGLVGFRSDREYAADGQCGTILKAYREHLTSANDRFLKKNWPRIKMALQYLIKHDANGDGLIEDAQPNTYDIDFFGANTFVGSLYLAALRCGEEMALEIGDSAFVAECRRIFDSGSQATMKRLWNGEYFIQEVDQSKYKQYQYGPGCLADQLFGQGWAHQVGIGHIYPAKEVVKALQSIWKYNWAPDVAGQNKRWPPQRPFAVPGEGGLFTCTWPIGGREQDPVLYRDEIWTGIEYQVAGHMIWEGLVEEGLSICRAVHERYHPLKRNPYNEVECSDHYSRAMASWGVLTALSGFNYHGPAGRIGFAPRISPSDFKSAFTAAEGWGTFSQQISPGTQKNVLSIAWGKLRLRELILGSAGSVAKVTVGGKPVASAARREGSMLHIALSDEVVLKAGQQLAVTVS